MINQTTIHVNVAGIHGDVCICYDRKNPWAYHIHAGQQTEALNQMYDKVVERNIEPEQEETAFTVYDLNHQKEMELELTNETL